MTRFTQATGLKVVSTTSAETVGKVDGFVIDGSRPGIVALELKKTPSGDILRWADVTAFGTDAVTVSGPDKITDGGDDLGALLDKSNRVLGKRVLATTGDELGKVDDVEFDPATGEVTGFVVGSGQIVGKRLVGIGSYAVVVEAD